MRPAIALLIGIFIIPSQAGPDQNQATAANTKPNGDEAEAAAAKWLDGLEKKGLVLNEKANKPGFVVTHGKGALGRVTTFSLQQSGCQLSLAFHGELSPETSLDTLKKNFWHITLDRLPTPGLHLPGWEIWPQTPRSVVEKGVEILAYHNGGIKVRVQTNFFALYGRVPSVGVPMDAPSPPGSYFQIRKEFPLDLTIEAPFAFRQ